MTTLIDTLAKELQQGGQTDLNFRVKENAVYLTRSVKSGNPQGFELLSVEETGPEQFKLGYFANVDMAMQTLQHARKGEKTRLVREIASQTSRMERGFQKDYTQIVFVDQENATYEEARANLILVRDSALTA